MVFVMPGFIFVRTREWFVPPVAKSDAARLTLSSITVSLAFVPLWLLAAADLLDLRDWLTHAASAAGSPSIAFSHRGIVAFVALALLLPVSTGFVAAIGYWQDWYPRIARRLLPRVGIPAPSRGLGDDAWDRLWLNFRRQPWLTIYTKDGPTYVGRGVELEHPQRRRRRRLDTGPSGSLDRNLRSAA